MLEERWTKSSLWPRLIVGMLVGVFLYQGLTYKKCQIEVAQPVLIQTASAAAMTVQEVVRTDADRLGDLARTDHIALLKWAMDKYRRQVQDYRLTFNKQERINDRLNPCQKISVNFKESPFSVLMKWQENPGTIDKLLYVEGMNDNKMLVHPSGLLGFIKSVKKDPDGPEARKSSRGTCDRFGFYRAMENLLSVYEIAQMNGDLKSNYLGETQVDGRPCVVIERLLPPKPEYPCARMVVAIDVEYVVPAQITSYDWQGNLLAQYTYLNVAFNVGMNDQIFTPAANSL